MNTNLVNIEKAVLLVQNCTFQTWIDKLLYNNWSTEINTVSKYSKQTYLAWIIVDGILKKTSYDQRGSNPY